MRKLPEPTDGGGRVETGAIQFGDDWPGLFVRGDNAFSLSIRIALIKRFITDAALDTLELEASERANLHFAILELESYGRMIEEEVVVKLKPQPGK